MLEIRIVIAFVGGVAEKLTGKENLWADANIIYFEFGHVYIHCQY